ncbi:hypothetical protein FM076_26270 [Streptomyces albus subsp. chlorinus]|nr:hypothetical protein [Streptomyces albus subsp. chlorinus]
MRRRSSRNAAHRIRSSFRASSAGPRRQWFSSITASQGLVPPVSGCLPYQRALSANRCRESTPDTMRAPSRAAPPTTSSNTAGMPAGSPRAEPPTCTKPDR